MKLVKLHFIPAHRDFLSRTKVNHHVKYVNLVFILLILDLNNANLVWLVHILE